MKHYTRVKVKEGDKYGSWVVLKELESYRTESGLTYRQCKCICKCGKEKDVKLKDLRNGKSKSCGCLNTVKVEKGFIYGRWKILKEVEKVISKSGITYRMCKCECECGTIKDVKLNILKSKESRSCGCLQKEKLGVRSTSHGMWGTKIYKVYHQMKRRCDKPQDQSYKNYGGRGIKNEWNSFDDFYYDMGKTYKEGLTLERNDNNGNYCKSNCSWETRRTQANNTTNVHNITHNGETHSIAEWARILNKNVSTLRVRIHRGKSIFN